MSYLQFDPSEFERKFPDLPFLVKHPLKSHPLFQLRRLVELSRILPQQSVEYNYGNVPVDLNPGETPRNGLTVQETIERIESCKSWLVLKNVEQDPAYAELLRETLGSVTAYSTPKVGKMEQLEGFIFISSPNSVTPYHMDPEHNFLLQVRGEKTVFMFNGKDPSILPDQELERYYTGGHRNLPFSDEVQLKGRPFKLTPGTGLHFPVNDPHWVQNGNAVSISFSITFRSPLSQRNARLYFLNNKLRRFGLTPTPVGRSVWRDSAKYGVWQMLHAVKSKVARKERTY